MLARLSYMYLLSFWMYIDIGGISRKIWYTCELGRKGKRGSDLHGISTVDHFGLH